MSENTDTVTVTIQSPGHGKLTVNLYPTHAEIVGGHAEIVGGHAEIVGEPHNDDPPFHAKLGATPGGPGTQAAKHVLSFLANMNRIKMGVQAARDAGAFDEDAGELNTEGLDLPARFALVMQNNAAKDLCFAMDPIAQDYEAQVREALGEDDEHTEDVPVDDDEGNGAATVDG